MTLEDEQDIQRECEALSISYARAVDFRNYDEFVLLFAEDGVLDVGKPLEGRAAIKAAMGKRSDKLRSRHVLSNIFTDVQDEQNARGISYLTLYRHIGEESLSGDAIDFSGPAAVGHYEDKFVLTDTGWCFASRKLHFAFRNEQQF